MSIFTLDVNLLPDMDKFVEQPARAVDLFALEIDRQGDDVLRFFHTRPLMSTTVYPACPKMPKGRSITVTPVISTRHITAEDNCVLENEANDIPHLYARHEYGWEFSLIGLKGGCREIINLELYGAGLSDVLINLLVIFADLGYDHLNIDRDGEVIEGLPQVYW